jgi:hypothetical protein
MYKHMPVIFARAFFLGQVNGIDNIVDRSITVAVHRNLHPGPVKFLHQFNHGLPLRNGIAAVVPVVFISRMVGFGQVSGVSLDGSVPDDFSSADLEKLSIWV